MQTDDDKLPQPLSQNVPTRIWLHDLGGGDITWCDQPDPDGEQIDAVEYVRVEALKQHAPDALLREALEEAVTLFESDNECSLAGSDAWLWLNQARAALKGERHAD